MMNANIAFAITVLASFAAGFMAARDHYLHRYEYRVRQLEREIELLHRMGVGVSDTPHADAIDEWLQEQQDGC